MPALFLTLKAGDFSYFLPPERIAFFLPPPPASFALTDVIDSACSLMVSYLGILYKVRGLYVRS